MTFDLTRRGLIAGAAIAAPTLALAQTKPQFGAGQSRSSTAAPSGRTRRPTPIPIRTS